MGLDFVLMFAAANGVRRSRHADGRPMIYGAAGWIMMAAAIGVRGSAQERQQSTADFIDTQTAAP